MPYLNDTGLSYLWGKIKAQLTARDTRIAGAESGVAIVIDGATASQNIAEGQFVYLRNHGTLTDGMYHASTTIASGTTLTSSNLAADADGGLNRLQGLIVYSSTQPSSPVKGMIWLKPKE